MSGKNFCYLALLLITFYSFITCESIIKKKFHRNAVTDINKNKFKELTK